MNSQCFCIKNIDIYVENELIEKGFILVKNGKIAELGDHQDQVAFNQYPVISTPPNSIAIPGMIDVHVHGANGADMMDATKEALETIAEALPKEGVTSFLTTSITQCSSNIEKALKNAGEYLHDYQISTGAELLGIHLEGPFINRRKAGAQPKEYIINPDINLFKTWQEWSGNTIKLVTLAPELPGGVEFISYLSKNGVIPSIGHSDATFNQVEAAMDAGLTHVAHMFNQMRGIHHREPGVAGAALTKDKLLAELIVDQIHVHQEMVNLAYMQKRSEKLLLITDAIRAKCLKNGLYELGGQEVIVTNGKAVLHDGTLAGSTLKMDQAFRNIINITNCSIQDAIKMTSTNAAKELNVYNRKGSLAKGKDADIVIFDENLHVKMTFCKGILVHDKEGGGTLSKG